jgi:hypothetical protein
VRHGPVIVLDDEGITYRPNEDPVTLLRRGHIVGLRWDEISSIGHEHSRAGLRWLDDPIQPHVSMPALGQGSSEATDARLHREGRPSGPSAHTSIFPGAAGRLRSDRVDEYSVARRPGAYVVTVPRTRRRSTLEECQALAEELALTQGLRAEPEIRSYGGGRASSGMREPHGWIFTWHC